MLVELRSLPNCPKLAQIRTSLYAALAELDLPPVVVERVGDFPSPTVLVDGVDVIGMGAGPASCRLDLPTVDDITAALRHANDPAADCRAQPGNPVRTGRPDRAARLTPASRRLYQAILWHFAMVGEAPEPADLAPVAVRVGLDLTEALRQLAADDLIAIDGRGALVAAYPFSAMPTPHLVSLGHTVVFAMCAIDALGIPFMLQCDAVVLSSDPQTGHDVEVSVSAGTAVFEQEQAVVVYAASAASGPSADTCCSTINFFASPGNARTWLADRPALTATVLDQDQAVRLARDVFASLLNPV